MTTFGAGAGGRPALQVHLQTPHEPPLRVFVVHLKAGADSVWVRVAQLTALEHHVSAAVRAPSGPDVVVLGDFNSVTEADRRRLQQFGERTGLVWASKTVGCTALHRGPRGCTSSALDHVFALRPRNVRALGPCAETCEHGQRCPTFVDQVSDHCPLAF